MKNRIEALHTLKCYLKQAKMAFTFEKKMVFEAVFNLKKGFRAEEIIEILKKGRPSISRSTTYRTLRIMETSGILNRIYRKGIPVYDFSPINVSYIKIICKKCGKTINIKNKLLLDILSTECENNKFSNSTLFVDITGICSNCKKMVKPPQNCGG